MYYTEALKKDSFTPSRFFSEGEIDLRGVQVKYHTVSEDNVFYDADGKPIASIYSYSYFRSDVADTASRPVIFAFNGGPGSSSMYVHTGFLAPKRLKYTGPLDRDSIPPYPITDNPDCLLDIADIVIVDMVGTGYGLLLDDTKKADFFGIEEDAEAFLNFVEMWSSRYERGLSPKYLVGESYGCTRAATAAGMSVSGGKLRSYGVKFNGLVLIGDTVTTGQYYGVDMGVPHTVLRFPSYAAINWYHNHPTNQSVDEFAMEAKAFADHDYLLALYKGEALQGEERKAIIDKIRYYTNCSEKYLEDNQLVIDEDTFRAEVIKDKGLAVGRCDGRFTRPLYTPRTAEADPKHAFFDDAAMDHFEPGCYAAMTGAFAPMLGIKLERNYVPSLPLWKDWKKECEGGTTGERLRDAMNMTFGMRTLFANGWYDICTEIGFVFYTMDHAGLPHDRVDLKAYPSGHMIYIGEENVKALSEDIRDFIIKK